MLTQLTQEMRAKYQIEQDMTAGPDLHDHVFPNSDQQRPKKLCNPPLHNNYLKQPQVKEEEVIFSSISQTPAQQQNSTSLLSKKPLPFVSAAARKLSTSREAVEVEEVEEKGPSLTRRPLAENQDGEEVSAVTKSSFPTSEAETAGGRASGSVLRNQVATFRQRHQEALRSIAHSPQPDIMSPAPGSHPERRPPDVVMPSLRYEPPTSLIVADAFNVMSTAQRKMLLDKSVVGSEANRQTPPGIPLLSEGPLTTTDDDAASEPSDIDTSKSASEDGKKSGKINEEELEPVRDQPDVAAADTRGHQHVDQPDTGGGHQRQVPKALHMRFQAELHQMESIEEAERQLNQLNRLRDVATARNEAVTAANYVQVQSGRSMMLFFNACIMHTVWTVNEVLGRLILL